MLRPLDEFFWILRRRGLSFGPGQAADAARAAALVGWGDRWALREALALVLVSRHRDRPLFDEIFDDFFRAERAHARDLFGRLEARGLSAADAGKLRELLEALAAGDAGAAGEGARLLLGLGGGLDGALASAGVRGLLSSMNGQRQVGYFAQQVAARLGLAAAGRGVSALRALLVAELGDEAGGLAASLLEREIELLRAEVRGHVEGEARGREAHEGRGFASLDPDEARQVRRAVRELGERLRGAARARARRWRRGHLDGRRVMREAARGGAPSRLHWRERRRQRPRLWVLCDVSDSVRHASAFLLEFVAAAQSIFEQTRTFVFVSDLAETTGLFARKGAEGALSDVLGGRAVSTARDSNYGRALGAFEARFGREIDRRSTVVIVGDGRTNYQEAGVEVVERLRERARAVLWLCPEPRGSWGTGDSAMPRFARAAGQVLSAATAFELLEAARALARRR